MCMAMGNFKLEKQKRKKHCLRKKDRVWPSSERAWTKAKGVCEETKTLRFVNGSKTLRGKRRVYQSDERV